MMQAATLFCIGATMLVAPTLHAQAPADWHWQLDGAARAPVSGDPAAGDWTYQAMAPGWHLTTTDQGVTLFPNTPHPMAGDWGVEMEFFLFPNPSDEGVGIALLPTTESEHKGELRLLLRRDGQVSITVFRTTDTIPLAPWTSDTAAAAHDGKEIKQYVLRVMHRGEQMTVAVNGRTMLTLPIGPNEQTPVAGVRAGPRLNLHISRFDLVTPLAP